MRRSRRRAGSGARGVRRRGSGRRRGFWVTAQLCAECLVQGGERDLAMPADVASPFEMIQAEAVFQSAIFMLDPPTHSGESNQLAQRGIARASNPSPGVG